MRENTELLTRFQKVRILLRFLSYLFLTVLFLFLLILYLLYLSAQRKPEFYKDELATPLPMLQQRNEEMLKNVNRLHNGIQSVLQKEKKTWKGTFTADEINGYFAVEAVKSSANILPAEIKEPRLTISPLKCELACLVEQDGFGGVLHLVFNIQLPEPNRVMLRIRNAQIGSIPVSRNYIISLLQNSLKQKGMNVTVGNEAGDPTLSFPLELNIGKKETLIIETLEIENGAASLTGSVLVNANKSRQ
ncbi:hypothetical protein FACS1894214_0370 [Planctomycetales bacterium]|nr:hypothetical protein FACS1894214_0370 [Planctomycetales bacterium]